MRRLNALLSCLLLSCLSLTGLCYAKLGARLPMEGEVHLSGLFTKLQGRLDHPENRQRVRLTHVGDSHIIADFWTGEMREVMQRRYGDGGRGYVLPGKAWRSFGQRHIQHRTEGEWETANIKRGRGRGWFGPGGLVFRSSNPDDRLEIFTKATQPASHFDRLDVLAVGRPGGGSYRLNVDSIPYGEVSTSAPYFSLLRTRYSLSEGAHRVSVSPSANGREITILGFSLERESGGLIYDAIGLNGAQAKQLLKNSQDALYASLRALESDVVILSYGINELFDHHYEPLRYERELTETLRLIREATPEASCLITGPFAAMLKGKPHPGLDAMYATQRMLASRYRCAFWDARAAMGDTLRPWQKARLAGRDGIHLTVRGYQRIAELFNESLELSFERWRAEQRASEPISSDVAPSSQAEAPNGASNQR